MDRAPDVLQRLERATGFIPTQLRFFHCWRGSFFLSHAPHVETRICAEYDHVYGRSYGSRGPGRGSDFPNLRDPLRFGLGLPCNKKSRGHPSGRRTRDSLDISCGLCRSSYVRCDTDSMESAFFSLVRLAARDRHLGAAQDSGSKAAVFCKYNLAIPGEFEFTFRAGGPAVSDDFAAGAPSRLFLGKGGGFRPCFRRRLASYV
jgi:hypothetical protein